MSAPPEIAHDTIYSNFDCEIDNNIVELLKENPNVLSARHAAWDFAGTVWFDGTMWHEEIWQYHSFVETISGDDALTLIEFVNDRYGWR